MVPRFTQSIMVKSEIKKPEDMAGKKIGVSRLGTVTHFALQTLLDGYGIKNVTILQMGGQPEAFAGLSRGSVDGAVFSPPYNFQLKKQGYHELASPNDLAKLTAFITNGIVARRSVAEKDKDTVIKTIKGTAEAIKIIQTDREFTKKVMSKWMPMKRRRSGGTIVPLRHRELCQGRPCPGSGAARHGQADGAEQLDRCQSGREHADDGLL